MSFGKNFMTFMLELIISECRLIDKLDDSVWYFM